MTRNEKITAGVVAVAFVLLLIWLFGRVSGSTTIVNEQHEGANYNLDSGGIEIPSLTLPPRRGAILWPTLDHGAQASGPLPTGSPYTDNSSYSGHSTCGCGDGTTQTYMRPPAPAATPQVVQQLYRSTAPAVRGLGFSDVVQPRSSTYGFGY